MFLFFFKFGLDCLLTCIDDAVRVVADEDGLVAVDGHAVDHILFSEPFGFLMKKLS